MWSIVEFEDGIMAVPSLWLSNSKKFCQYPLSTKKDEISKAVRQLHKPTDDWTSYEVKRIFSTAATYKDAMRKESLAVALTDCEDDSKSNEESQTQVSTQLNKGSNKQNVISSSSDDEDEDETTEKRLKNEKKLPPMKNTEAEQLSVTKIASTLPQFKPIPKLKSDRVVDREQNDLDSNQNIAKPKVKSNESYNIMDKLNYIIQMQEENAKKTHRILLELKDIPKLILEQLKEVSLSNKNEENSNEKDLSSRFPLKTEEELSAFEGLLENNNIKKEVIDLLARRGGKDVATLTNNILARVMVDQLAKNFSFKGKQKKTAFSSFVLSNCIIAAVMKMFPEATETAVELKIGSWLANAPFRQKKNDQKTEENDGNEKFEKKNKNED
ncbi:uncharacterized protein LOC106655007 [Trichogramma pretiosum]|uniref:uncharacterized protein LOC111693316 n=1 Tax=Trichogramma pretiosum TaxID=7493 RepID=UPI000C71C3D8|nr:uncharacterized protein LOC111693316 [Trichogramma pretiosum]XP_023317276.1 uncharacterized protein LOC106655007 [Trichogramma pretiosum]